MSNKIYSHGNIPFSWENKPGVSKVEQQDHTQMALHDLAPPLLPENSKASSIHHEMKIPLPPPPVRSSSRRGLKKIEDPFLMAYKECTKSSKNEGFGLKRNMSIFSCKKSCSVVEDSIVKPSQFLVSRSMRERKGLQS
ncbi:uncharacterized protein Fot_42428 [Forsythia ovata]|uniref:Uncharacterized protein n=1 Tax=Forsythia ovata TaxID=205694 RepID=A0ABD1RL06_9LAMI